MRWRVGPPARAGPPGPASSRHHQARPFTQTDIHRPSYSEYPGDNGRTTREGIQMTGRKLGNYEVLDKLGEGGMGEVWRARDERLNRTVAVKILPADMAGDPSRRLRFEQEARALGALNHPNIVAVYDVGQSDGQSYIVSELVDGESLRKVIDRGPIPSRRLLDMAVQTAEALAAAHALGIVHRDLKPENIMVTGPSS